MLEPHPNALCTNEQNVKLLSTAKLDRPLIMISLY